MTKLHDDTFSITFGDVAEHDYRAVKHGELAARGISVAELRGLYERWGERGARCEFVHLTPLLRPYIDPSRYDVDQVLRENDAAVLLVRGGVDALCGPGTADAMYAEQRGIAYDTMGVMYGKLRNKLARHTTVFGPVGASSTLAVAEGGEATGEGGVVAFSDVPHLDRLRNVVMSELREVGFPVDLRAEGNHYYQKGCGIGFHGDAERRVVVCARLGAGRGTAMPLVFQWHVDGKIAGPLAAKLIPRHGDMYVMSDKAVGTRWRKDRIHLRHAAGAAKYLVPTILHRVSDGDMVRSAVDAAEELEAEAVRMSHADADALAGKGARASTKRRK